MARTPEFSRAYKRLGLSFVMALGISATSMYEVSHAQSPTKTANSQRLADLSVRQALKDASKSVYGKPLATTTTMATTTTAPPLTPAEWAARQLTPADYAAWEKVHDCEEPGLGWHVNGAEYGGGIGISRKNWNSARYGGLRDFGDEAAATEAEQIVVGKRIQPNPPDQHGCQPGGW